MRAAQHIKALDRALASAGEPVVLRKFTGTGSNPLAKWTDLTLIAKVNPLTPEEIAAGVNQRRRNLILPPITGRAPVVGRDAIMFGSDKFVVQQWHERRIGGDVVRVEVQAG